MFLNVEPSQRGELFANGVLVSTLPPRYTCVAGNLRPESPDRPCAMAGPGKEVYEEERG